MKVTLNPNFSDFAGMTPATCDNCNKPLPNAQRLFNIDDNVDHGWFCSYLCAHNMIETIEHEE